LSHHASSVRFHAAYTIGNLGIDTLQIHTKLLTQLKDDSPSVRIAAARALCLTGNSGEAASVLRDELKTNSSHAVRHYAALFLDDIGDNARVYLPDFKLALNDPYEPVRAVVKRLVAKFKNI
jgi:HEAT repeat protein